MDSRNLPDYVAELKDRLDIYTVVNRYVTLKKSGSRYIGICPFHNDRKPSMYVTPQMGIYKCFVCGAGGDAIKFVQEYEKLPFMDALKQLSQEAGLPMPEEFHKSGKSGDKKSRILELNGLAGDAFQKKLAKTDSVQAYLRDRGISPEVQKKFQLGLSPDNWNGLLTYAKGKGYGEQELLEGGLIKAKERGGFRDLFVNRLMFPIWNLSHRIVAFGGRTLDKDGVPKYLNSPETPVYHKSNVLYGLNFARNQVQATEELILVEGYMDVLALYQVGIENVAAVSGTSLTDKHGESIARLAKKVLFFLDGDNAGRQAIERSLPILLRFGIEVRVPELPKGEDPDSYALQYGKEGVEKLLLESANVVDYITRDFRINPSNYSPEKKEWLLKSCMDILNNIPSEWVRAEYQKQLHTTLGASEILGKSSRPSNASAIDSRVAEMNPRASGVGGGAGLPRGERLLQRVAYKVRKEPEWRLAQLLISSEALCRQALADIQLSWLEDALIRDLIDRLLVHYEQEQRLSLPQLLGMLPETLRELVESMDVLDVQELELEAFCDIVDAIHVKSLNRSIKGVQDIGSQEGTKQYKRLIQERNEIQKASQKIRFKGLF
jgi:DNA primase